MKKEALFVIILLLIMTSGISGCDIKDEKAASSEESSDNNTIKLPEELGKIDEIEEEEEDENEDKELSFEEKVWKRRIDLAMAPSYCPNVSIFKPNISYYTGPLIDTHLHMAALPDSGPGEEEGEEEVEGYDGGNEENDDEEGWEEEDEEDNEDPDSQQAILGKNLKMSEVVCSLNQANVDKAFAFFPVYPEISMQLMEVANRTMQKYPGKFVPFIMPPDSDNDPEGSSTVNAETLQKMLESYPDLFKGYGEIGLYQKQGGASELLPDDQRLLGIYPILKNNKLIVYFHPGENQEDNLAKVLKEYQEINFIVHGDQIQQSIVSLMDEYPNIYYTMDALYGDEWLLRNDITKERFLAYFEDYEPLIRRDLSLYEHMINSHPDRFMWGTDRGVTVWTNHPEVSQTLANYARALIARLNPNVQENFAYKNAERLLSN